MLKHPRIYDERHLAFIRTLSCLVCGDNTSCEAAHVRFGDLTVGKLFTGRMKPDDKWTVPLCSKCHRQQHAYPGGEREYWKHFVRVDPLRVAMALALASGDYARGEEIVGLNRLERAA